MTGAAVPRTRWIARPDAVLRGEEVGAGPTYVLLHAGGERRHVWAPVSKALVDAGFRCVAFDQRGHGDSDGDARTLAACAEDVAAVVCGEPSGCVVVGASLGGLAAVAALTDPAVRARVAGLVLVDVVPCLDAPRVRAFLAAGGLAGAYAELVEDILAHVPVLRQVTAELDLPVLLVHGGTGSSVGAEDIDELLRLAPHTTVLPVRDAGHLIAREQPAALARTVIAATAAWHGAR
ncbi:Lysophospholipase, alpha-beta hydrolase superfamily [Streptomyces sp. TLI_053]|uniref:alpha/beta fold hydrolase n=1 Tax=Streptomyces sp. TLI_053 TaxID=1855352 RepID=UPI0008799DA5|nr:alpha/beta hydrolase [Streptomyces sp. TLI_053]SDS69499.1 Lysophospholipase, alpha-beta hydrolase superfamily [Streptomyces sp. TLI_053]